MFSYFRCGTSCCVVEGQQNEKTVRPTSADQSVWFQLPEGLEGLDMTDERQPAGDPNGLGLEDRGAVELESGATYTGQWLGEHRHGQGIIVRTDGGKYDGQFKESRASGVGRPLICVAASLQIETLTCRLARFIHANGDMYDGEWVSDKAHGRGKFQHADGSSYTGEWCQDTKAGHGIETWVDGSHFKGEYRSGVKHGFGIFTSSDGSTYSGQFLDDCMDGEGTYTFADGRVYQGRWSCSQMHGTGQMKWPDGRCYEGEFVQDRKQGEGSFSWPDGRSYSGQWLGGKQHGTGDYKDAKGKSRKGEWNEGQRVAWLTS